MRRQQRKKKGGLTKHRREGVQMYMCKSLKTFIDSPKDLYSFLKPLPRMFMVVMDSHKVLNGGLAKDGEFQRQRV